MTTEATDAVVDTMMLFTRYRPSGIVDHMSTNGDTVMWLGNHRNAPSTSGSGLSDDVSITYTGARANSPSRVRPITRAQGNHQGECTTRRTSPFHRRAVYPGVRPHN